MSAEQKPVLEWMVADDGLVRASCVPLSLRVDPVDNAWVVFGDYRAEGPTGTADSLLAAQLAAEDAALTWLREGVEALGGRVLTGEQVALCVEALRAFARELAGNYGEPYERLARELGGDRG